MESLYLLVPISVVAVFGIGWVFWRALSGGQFDDLDRPAQDVLMDDDRPQDGSEQVGSAPSRTPNLRRNLAGTSAESDT